MSTVAALDTTAVDVLPGEEAACGLRIRNDGAIVESYAVQVLGEPAAWATVEPDTLSVFPGTEGLVTVRFRPPRSATLGAGELPFGVRVMPVERPAEQMVPEGRVRILPFADTSAEITPRTSSARRSARHEVAVDNRGNVPIQVSLGGSDPDRRLGFTIRPTALTVGAGQAAFATVKVRPRRWLWTGQPVTYPFQVRIAPDAHAPLTLDATTVQTPIVPRGTGKALATLLVLALVGAGLWWGVLRPAVRSAAQDATADQIAPVMRQAAAASAAAQQAAQDVARVTGGGASPGAPGGGVNGAASPTAAAPAPGAPGGPAVPAVPAGASSVTRRLQASSVAGATDTDQYTVPAGQTFVLTDIFFQNPQGDDGRLDLLIDGQTLLTVTLANFRDLDYHTVSPIEAAPGTVVSIRATCATPGRTLAGATGGARCRVFALLGGYQRGLPSPTPSPTPTPSP